jgi:hypothetical protein
LSELDFRSGSKPEVATHDPDVCFDPESRHQPTQAGQRDLAE